MKKKSNDKEMIKMQILLPDSPDGKLTQFVRALDTCLTGFISIESITPSDQEDMIIFNCEVPQDKFDKFSEIYQRIYERNFSINWEA